MHSLFSAHYCFCLCISYKVLVGNALINYELRITNYELLALALQQELMFDLLVKQLNCWLELD